MKKVLCIIVAILLACISQYSSFSKIDIVNEIDNRAIAQERYAKRLTQQNELNQVLDELILEHNTLQQTNGFLKKENNEKKEILNQIENDRQKKHNDYLEFLNKYQALCSVPDFNYNLSGTLDASNDMNIFETVGNVLTTGTFWGDLLKDMTINSVSKDITNEAIALLEFNNTMEQYIESHSGCLNKLYAKNAELEYLRSFLENNQGTDTNDEKIIIQYLDKVLMPYFEKGVIKFDYAAMFDENDWKDLMGIRNCADMIANAYSFVLGDGYQQWEEFTNQIDEILAEYSELVNLLSDEEREEYQFVHVREYSKLIDKYIKTTLTCPKIHMKEKRIWVSGKGDIYFLYYIRETDTQYVCYLIREQDWSGNILSSYAFDRKNKPLVISDKTYQKDYYVMNREYGSLTSEDFDNLLRWVDWVGNAYYIDTYNADYAMNRMKLENIGMR